MKQVSRLCLALLGALFLWLFLQTNIGKSSILGDPAERLADRAMRLQPVPADSSGARLVFLRIGNETTKTWGRNRPMAITPRKHISDLLVQLKNSAASAIFVNVDISAIDGEPDAELSLSRTLNDWKNSQNVPKLVLGRISRNGNLASTPYDEVVQFGEDSNVVWGTSELSAFSDGVTRLASTWFCPTLLDDSEQIWSLSLLAATHIIGESLSFSEGVDENCSVPNWKGHELHEAERIRFHAVEMSKHEGQNNFFGLNSYEACNWTHPEICRSGRPPLQDAVVFIGRSGADAPDILNTPIGLLPSTIAHMNHARALAIFGPTRQPLWYIQIFFIAGYVVFLWFLFELITMFHKRYPWGARTLLGQVLHVGTHPLITQWVITIIGVWSLSMVASYNLQWAGWQGFAVPGYFATLLMAITEFQRESE